MSKLPKSKKAKDSKAAKPQIMQAGDSNSGECTWKTFRNKVVYAEPLQNATSRRILSMYYQQQPPTNVPVDVRSGLDVRTLAPAQDPNYLVPKLANTFETNVKSSVKPFYEGGLLNRLRHGFGKSCFRNAAFTYEGEWAHGNFQGQGKLQLPDGVYEGDFRNGEITGSGMRCWNDGTQYTGEFLDGEMHGQGLFLRADGERYEGGFVRNQRSGSGVLVTPDGTCYEGFFEEHRLNGHGSYEGISGDRYQGDWCNGNMDGNQITQITCFTSTNAQMLTLVDRGRRRRILVRQRRPLRRPLRAQPPRGQGRHVLRRQRHQTRMRLGP